MHSTSHTLAQAGKKGHAAFNAAVAAVDTAAIHATAAHIMHSAARAANANARAAIHATAAHIMHSAARAANANARAANADAAAIHATAAHAVAVDAAFNAAVAAADAAVAAATLYPASHAAAVDAAVAAAAAAAAAYAQYPASRTAAAHTTATRGTTATHRTPAPVPPPLVVRPPPASGGGVRVCGKRPRDDDPDYTPAKSASSYGTIVRAQPTASPTASAAIASTATATDNTTPKCRKGFSNTQRLALVKLYEEMHGQMPTPDKVNMVAERLGCTPLQVGRWFARYKAALKRQAAP